MMINRREVRVSEEVVDLLTAWFPDCGGIVNVDDALDAMYGHGVKDGELHLLLNKLSDEGVDDFIPYYLRETAPEKLISRLLVDLRELGFGTDEEIDGGDCVDKISEWFPALVEAIGE